MTPDGAVYDVIGVGFGPSNLALAIALQEAESRCKQRLRAHFIEKQTHFIWHGGMLLPGSDMQISFLKDLVSLRDPSSRFTFLSYLHAKGRIEAFINRKTFYPSRVEFNDYFCWAAQHFEDLVSYGEEVVAIEPEGARAPVRTVAVRSRDRHGRERTRLARNLVVATGGQPHVPGIFRGLKNNRRVFHSSSYMTNVAEAGFPDAPAARIAVIGRGQSAAEIALDLYNRFSQIRIDLILRGFALRPSDDTPFVNEIFDPASTDFIFKQSASMRESILTELRNTNYAVVDADIIQTLYNILYQQKVDGSERLRILPMREIEKAAPDASGGVVLTMRDHMAGSIADEAYSGAILATGYERNNGAQLLEGVQSYITGTAAERNYRLKTRPEFLPTIHMQGYSETTHGLSDTLLSVLPIRADEIARSLLAACDARQSAA